MICAQIYSLNVVKMSRKHLHPRARAQTARSILQSCATRANIGDGGGKSSQRVLGRVDEREARGVELPRGRGHGTRRRRHRERRVLLLLLLLLAGGGERVLPGARPLPLARPGQGQRRGAAGGHGAGAVGALVRVEEDADVRVAGLQGDLEGRAAVHVEGARVAVRVAEEQPHDVGVAVLGGAHQGRAAVLVLQVHRRARVQQQAGHVPAAVRDGEHQGRLSVLRRGRRG